MTDERRESEPTLQAIEFDYIKGNRYRNIYVTGAFGGITPQGVIHMDLFSEYSKPPETMSFNVTPDGKFKEAGRTGKQNIVRELEVGIILSVDTARSIAKWLEEKAKEIEQLRDEIVEKSGDSNGEREQE